MFVVWSGNGLFALMLGMGFPLAFFITANATHLYNGFFLPFGFGLVLAGVSCRILGRRWNNPPSGDIEEMFGLDPAPRPMKKECVRHTLYFIPVEYWGGVFLALGLVMLGKTIVMGDLAIQ